MPRQARGHAALGGVLVRSRHLAACSQEAGRARRQAGLAHHAAARRLTPTLPKTRLLTRAAHGTGAGSGGAGERSGGVGPPRPVRRPEGGEAGERVTQRERSPAPDDRPRPPRAPHAREWIEVSVVDMFATPGRGCAETLTDLRRGRHLP